MIKIRLQEWLRESENVQNDLNEFVDLFIQACDVSWCM